MYDIEYQTVRSHSKVHKINRYGGSNFDNAKKNKRLIHRLVNVKLISFTPRKKALQGTHFLNGCRGPLLTTNLHENDGLIAKSTAMTFTSSHGCVSVTEQMSPPSIPSMNGICLSFSKAHWLPIYPRYTQSFDTGHI